VGADRDEDGVKPAVPPLRVEVLDEVVAGDPYAELGDPRALGVEDVARQAV
jgi:hypothetical protein